MSVGNQMKDREKAWIFGFGLQSESGRRVPYSRAEELLNYVIEWAEERDLTILGGFHGDSDEGTAHWLAVQQILYYGDLDLGDDFKEYLTRENEIATEQRAAVVELLHEVLEGTVTLSALYDRWPFDEEDERFDDILETLADAVEHTPGRWLRGGVDHRAWCATSEYRQIYLDLKLFEAGLTERTLLSLRRQVDVEKLRGLYEVDLYLKKAFAAISRH